MTWREWTAARQLLAEEFVGRFHRQAQVQEDAEFARSAANLRRPDRSR